MQDEIIQNLVSELIKQFTVPILNGLNKLTKDANNKIQVSLNLCFSGYLERNYERYSKIKTLLYREKPVNIKDFYIRTDLKIQKKVVEESQFINEIEVNKRLIIQGGAGSGKSTFCKSLFIELIEKPIGIFPIFIELRHLNNQPDKSIYNFILNSMIAINPSFNKEQLDYALKLGKVLAILDGFDEINREDREDVEREILNLSNNYHGIRILISSRFDTRFTSWEEFYQYTILELDKNKALSLINRLDYDRQVKQSFLKELDNRLYDSHRSFASNPLLLTMMLLTYEQIAEIPNKLHLFYEQAFLTLFNKHDSLKSMYKRKSFCGLPLDDFKRCLEAFCILSYCDKLYYFEENQIKKYLDNSILISSASTQSEDFLSDLIGSVCILQRDGLGFNFTHRSFQEYFSALFLVNRSSTRKYDLFEKIFNISRQDNVINMVNDINPSLLEKEWIIPKTEKIVSDIDSILGYKNYELIILQKMYSSISVHYDEDDNEELIVFGVGGVEKYNVFCSLVRGVYQENYKIYSCNKKARSNDAKYFEEQLIEHIRKNGDIDLENLNRIDPYVFELIKKSNIVDGIVEQLGFLKFQASLLKNSHAKQDLDIVSFILN
ncbi:NACHT domain-containing protein [Acinetobacter sp. ME22]|uniref:NACHT domain-containing protein n=1 Tax=Acinetobacter sp. ME22 TaxID=2904802 RepID=UPI001EDBB945|nr:NACHT domain-containing protein [Acinetobacter sp. ME22]MCG2572876.1 NACHT domain-containing protein [Acinetobacter sp. ME22]